MASLKHNGKAVQILRINDDHSFELNESLLEAILLDERIRDKSVAVVSVAGAYRQGKSFLLSFFLRYLGNNCQSDWLGDSRAPLGGFEWSPGSKPHTTGILLWSEVFVVTTPQGEEVAVLLMDTQGSFDCNSTVKDCTTIFALSIMTSSVQVYNVFRNIQEDQLQHLQFFTEYGRLAQQAARREAFQRLVFLVRDWAFPYEADYGAVGGRAILNERLQVRNEQHDDLQRIRQEIWSCFSEIDCFLMPRPGDKVATDMSFDGCLNDIDETFKQKMQELVPWLLAPKNLVVKKINGQNITCEELMNYFRVYARAFQGGTLPEPKSVLQATAEASNVAAKDKATRFYIECMEKIARGSLDELQEAHLLLLEEAAEIFRRSPRVGGEEVSQRYLENLTTELLAYCDHIYKEQELFILREFAHEEEIQVEREVERQRDEERQIERRREKEKLEQRDWEKAFELQSEMHMDMERERERKEQLERERQSQREIEDLRERIAQVERERDERASQQPCVIS